MTAKTSLKVSPVNMAERAGLDIRPGTTVKVYQKIQEKGKTRLQVFEGLIIARKHHTEAGATFTVRKVASGVGMEKIFPLYSPMVDKIEIVKRSKVRRAKLYYIREKAAKEVRRRMKQLSDEARQKREEQEAEARVAADKFSEEEPAEPEPKATAKKEITENKTVNQSSETKTETTEKKNQEEKVKSSQRPKGKK